MAVARLLVVGQSAGQSEGRLDTAAGHRLHVCLYEGAYGPRGDCRDIRGSLAGCLYQATISAFRFRSSQSGKWDLLCLISIDIYHRLHVL